MVRTTFLAAMVLAVSAGSARAERFLTFGGSSQLGGTYYVGTTPLGSSTVTPLLSGTLAPLEESDLALRDRMMPDVGMPNVGKRARPTINGVPVWAIRVMHSDNMQFWASSDGVSWTPVASRAYINGVQIDDLGSNGFTLAGNVPAVSAWGLVVLLLAVAVAGTVVPTRRRVSGADAIG